MTREENHKIPLVNEDCSSGSGEKFSAKDRLKEFETTIWDHSSKLKHRAHDSSFNVCDKVEDIKDHIQLIAEADGSEAMSLCVLESPNDSNKHLSELMKRKSKMQQKHSQILSCPSGTIVSMIFKLNTP